MKPYFSLLQDDWDGSEHDYDDDGEFDDDVIMGDLDEFDEFAEDGTWYYLMGTNVYGGLI